MFNRLEPSVFEGSNRILFVFSLFGAYPDNNYLDNIIAQHLESFGWRVVFVTCQCTMPSCDHHLGYKRVYGYDRSSTCKVCNSSLARTFQRFGLNDSILLGIGDFLSSSEISECYTTAYSLQNNKISGYIQRKSNIPYVSLANELRISMTLLCQMTEEEQLGLYKYYLVSEHILRKLSAKLNILACQLKQNNPDLKLGLLLTHAHRSLTQAFLEGLESEKHFNCISYTQLSDSRVVFWCTKDNVFKIAGGNASAIRNHLESSGIKGLGYTIDDVETSLASCSMALASLLNRTPDETNATENPTKSLADYQIKQDGDLSPDLREILFNLFRSREAGAIRKVIVLFMSNESEGLAYGICEYGLTQNRILSALEQMCREDKDLYVIVRDHPSRYSNSDLKATDEYDYFQYISHISAANSTYNTKNLLFIPAYEHIASTDLIQLADIVISPTSTTAVEAVFLGKQSYTLTDSEFSFLSNRQISPSATAEEIHKKLNDDLNQSLLAGEGGGLCLNGYSSQEVVEMFLLYSRCYSYLSHVIDLHNVANTRNSAACWQAVIDFLEAMPNKDDNSLSKRTSNKLVALETASEEKFQYLKCNPSKLKDFFVRLSLSARAALAKTIEIKQCKPGGAVAWNTLSDNVIQSINTLAIDAEEGRIQLKVEIDDIAALGLSSSTRFAYDIVFVKQVDFDSFSNITTRISSFDLLTLRNDSPASRMSVAIMSKVYGLHRTDKDLLYLHLTRAVYIRQPRIRVLLAVPSRD